MVLKMTKPKLGIFIMIGLISGPFRTVITTDNSKNMSNSADTGNPSDTRNPSDIRNPSNIGNLSATGNSSDTDNPSDTGNPSLKGNPSDTENLSDTSNQSDTGNLRDAGNSSVTGNQSNTGNPLDSTGMNSTSIIYGTSLLAVSLLVVLCNGTVVLVILRTDNPNMSSLSLNVHMAFWDLIRGLLFLVIPTPSAFLNRFAYPESLTKFVGSLIVFVMSVSTLITVTIVVDRFITLKWPLFHRKHATKKTYVFTAVLAYILSFMQICVVVFPDTEFKYDVTVAVLKPTSMTTHGKIASTGVIVVSILITTVFSSYILRMIYRRKRRVGSELEVPMSRNLITRSLMCVLVAATFCMCYLPILMGVVFNAVLFNRFAVVTYISNSIWNVVIYSANYRPFREAFFKLFFRSYYRKIKLRNQLKKTPPLRNGVFKIKINSNVDVTGLSSSM